MIKWEGIQCKKCGDIIYSRARHDMRFCSCGAVSVDGGRFYCHVSGKSEDVRRIIINFKSQGRKGGYIRRLLFVDWGAKINEYGRIDGFIALMKYPNLHFTNEIIINLTKK